MKKNKTDSWNNLRQKRLESPEYERLRVRNREYRRQNRDKINESASVKRKQTYAERKASGICVKCGKNPAADRHVLCADCRTKHNFETALKKKLLKSHGICIQCKKRDAISGLTICNECRLYNNQMRSGYVEHRPDYVRKRKYML